MKQPDEKLTYKICQLAKYLSWFPVKILYASRSNPAQEKELCKAQAIFKNSVNRKKLRKPPVYTQ